MTKPDFLNKNLVARIWDNGAKIGPETRFFCHYLKFGSLVFLEIAYNDSLQQCLTSSRGEIYEKKIGGPNFGQTGQNQARN